MKVKLEMELTFDDDVLVELGKNTEEELKEELTQRLFEACEDWVLHGQEPDLEFSD